MREVVTKVYKFDELDDRAKQKVLERMIDVNVDHDWYEHTYDDFVAICKAMGIELDTYPVKLMGGGVRSKPAIYFSGLSSQGGGACFEGVYRTDKNAGTKIKEHAPQDTELHAIADRLVELSSAYPEGVRVRVSQGAGRSNMLYVQWAEAAECEDLVNDEYYTPEMTNEDEFLDCLRDLANWLYSTLEKEYDYLTSDDAIIETIKCNDYEFTVDGELH